MLKVKRGLVFFIISIILFNVHAIINGDINNDDKISALDYIIIRKHLMGKELLTGDNLKKADVNKDNKISSLDYVAIRLIILSDINIKTKSLDLVVGTEKNIEYNINNNNSYVEVSFSSNNTKVATVDASGKVKGITKGKAIITVTTSNGKTGACEVNVITCSDTSNLSEECLVLENNIATASISLPDDSYTYNGKEIKPEPEVKMETVVLQKDKDYTLEYKDNIDAGKAVLIINGKGNYTGRKEYNYIINKASLDVNLESLSNLEYTGSKVTANKASTAPNISGATFTYKYYTNNTCTKGETEDAPINVGTYYVKATFEETKNYNSSESKCVSHVISKASTNTFLESIIKGYTGEVAIASGATAKLSNNKELNDATFSYRYYSDKTCNKEISIPSKVGQYYAKALLTETQNYKGSTSSCVSYKINNDRIHFINEGGTYSDLILLESEDERGKHFALIDTGNNSTRTFTDENGVVYNDMNSYLKNYLKEAGVDKLEFLLITHNHGDHQGGAVALIKSDYVQESTKLYIKEYFEDDDPKLEKEEVFYNYNSEENKRQLYYRYVKIINAANEKKLTIEYVNRKPEDEYGFTFGNMKIKLYNTAIFPRYCEKDGKKYAIDDNANSILELITVNDNNILLTGDLSPSLREYVKTDLYKKMYKDIYGEDVPYYGTNGNEKKIELSLLKLPHHNICTCAFYGKSTVMGEKINDNAGEVFAPKRLIGTGSLFAITKDFQRCDDVFDKSIPRYATGFLTEVSDNTIITKDAPNATIFSFGDKNNVEVNVDPLIGVRTNKYVAACINNDAFHEKEEFGGCEYIPKSN